MLKQLRDQGLPLRNLHTVFSSHCTESFAVCFTAWGPLLNVELVHKTDGFLKHSFRYGFTSKLLIIEPILNGRIAVEDLLCKMQLTNHCLHPLLPPDKTLSHMLKDSGHAFQLPTCMYNLQQEIFCH